MTGGSTAAVRAVGLLGGMLTYAREMGYIEHNPARGIRKPADKRRSFRLAPEEYRSLGQALEAAEGKGEHWQATAAIRLIALTGCRRSEILHLRWSEVDFQRLACVLVTPKPAPPAPATRDRPRDPGAFKPDGDYVFPGRQPR